SKHLRPHCRRTMPADFPGSIGSMRGSRNAVSLAPTCTRRGGWVNQAEHLNARVAKAPEGIGALWRLDSRGKAAPQPRPQPRSRKTRLSEGRLWVEPGICSVAAAGRLVKSRTHIRNARASDCEYLSDGQGCHGAVPVSVREGIHRAPARAMARRDQR